MAFQFLSGFSSAFKSWEDPRNRFNVRGHIDLQEVLTNSGAMRFNGGLNLAATILGKPGKMDTKGFMVQDLWHEGKVQEIDDYCICDALIPTCIPANLGHAGPYRARGGGRHCQPCL